MKAVVDRIVQYANRYKLTDIETGNVLGTFDFDEVTGTVQQVGTEIDKELFDSIANDLAARLVANGGDSKDLIVTFTAATSVENIATNEKHSIIFGKIAKWFTDRISKLKKFTYDSVTKITSTDIDGTIPTTDALENGDITVMNAEYANSASRATADKNGKDITTYVAKETDPTVPAWAKNATKPTYTKAEVGLGNVDNTADSEKPISTATQNALNAKVDKVSGKGLSTNDYTTAEKNKLAGLAEDAVRYGEQSLTQVQKSQARSNIGAGTSDFDGTWGSLSGKPDVVQPNGSYPNLTAGKANIHNAELLALDADLNTYYGKEYWGKNYYVGGGNSIANRPVENDSNGFSLEVLRGSTADTVQRCTLYARGGSSTQPVVFTRWYIGTEWKEWQEAAEAVGTYPNMTVGNATNATNDGNGDNISATYAKQTEVSNPNLLINPDFSINQRGQTSYIGGGGAYCVDMWILSTGTTAEIQTSGALKLTRTTSGNCCLQRIADWKKLVGKTVTLSVKFSQITAGTVRCNIYTGTTFNGTNVSTSGSVSSITLTIPTDATRVECFIFARSACEFVPEYAKLEIGSVATAFVPPLRAEELWKCLNLTKSTAFPTSESQTSDTNILSEKAVYGNFVLNNKQQYLRDNYFAVTENGKYGMFFESGKLTEPWDSISMTFMLSDKNALNNAISTTIYELSYRANSTSDCTVVLRRIAGDNQADNRLYVDYVNTGYSANSNYFRLYYLSAFSGDDSRAFTLLAYNQRFKASYFDYTTYSGNLTLLDSISSIGTTTRFSTIVSSPYETPSGSSWERFTEFSNNGFGLKFPEFATYTLMLFFNSTWYPFTIDIPSSSLHMAFWRYVGETGGYKFYMDSDEDESGYGRNVLIARDSNNAEVKLSDIMNLPYYHKIRG